MLGRTSPFRSSRPIGPVRKEASGIGARMAGTAEARDLQLVDWSWEPVQEQLKFLGVRICWHRLGILISILLTLALL
jgi:hypothetical protein